MQGLLACYLTCVVDPPAENSTGDYCKQQWRLQKDELLTPHSKAPRRNWHRFHPACLVHASQLTSVSELELLPAIARGQLRWHPVKPQQQ